MEENGYLDKFEESRLVSENYFRYILRQNDEQREQSDGMSRSLDSVVEEVRASGLVSAIAAQESLQSHNKTFVILAAISRAQDYLTQLVADIKQNGGIGGGGDGSISSILGASIGGAATGGALAALVGPMLGIAVSNPVLLIPTILAAVVAGGAAYIKNKKAQAAKEDSKPFLNNALSSSSSAREIAEEIAFEQNNPRSTNEAASTFAGAIAMQATSPSASSSVTKVPNPSTGADESTQIYNMQTHVAAMQPQSVQVVTQPASTSVAPEQTINFNIQNDFNGNWQDRRGLEDIGEYLARQVKDRLNSGAPLFSGN